MKAPKRRAAKKKSKQPTRKSKRLASKMKNRPRRAAKAYKPDHDLKGPIGWLLPTLESSYAPLVQRGVSYGANAVAMAVSSLRPAKAATLAAVAPTTWRDVMLAYKQRKASRVAPPPGPAKALAAPAAFVPGARNWQPLGPTVVLHGQTVGNQPVAGRVARLAIAPGAAVVYAATANGGVFRSNNGGTSWLSLMDRFDLDPTSFASASLACGAIAIDAKDPNRVYVGTGEGDTLQLFQRRVTNALPAYRGVGVIRTDDGGVNWVAEPSNPDLAGEAFFEMAVDPANRENAVAATTKGLYQRQRNAAGAFEWKSVRSGTHASAVVSAAAGATHFFAAEWRQDGQPSGVFHSTDGSTWAPAGTNFPANGVGRIALGVRPDAPDVLYAFVATRDTGLAHGLYRLDGVGSVWKQVAKLPDVLPKDPNSGTSQGDYDLSIAVDPADSSIVYLGGSYADVAGIFPASIWRCNIAKAGPGFKVAKSASIGTQAHSDVHALTHTPGTPSELWCACDGGVFLNRDPRGTGEFDSQNNGLACLCSNFIAQHPTDPSIMFTGLQDNGTARANGAGSMWTHVMGGDGGYCLIHWANPKLVLVFENGSFFRSDTGGESEDAWSQSNTFGWMSMTQPMATAPFNPAKPAEADLVAAGAGDMVQWSTDFGFSWTLAFSIPADSDAIFALALASPKRLFAATTAGRVFQADRTGNTWTVKQIDQAPAGPLGLNGIINDVAIDWADPQLQSIYVAFAGHGDRRRVWWYDGVSWHDRSGAAGPNGLLDVEHNALAVDRTAPNNVYVGADIGVWHSTDRGQTWNPLENGLPDAPVFDLQIHPTQRLLRAATYGRGVYEFSLS